MSIDHNMGVQYQRNTVNQGYISLSTHYLEYGRHVARLHRRRRRAHAPTSNTTSHDNHEKINSWVSFCFPYEYGAPHVGPSGHRSSAIRNRSTNQIAGNSLFSSEIILKHFRGLATELATFAISASKHGEQL